MKDKQVYLNKTRWEVFRDNFWGGVAWGLGTVVGAGILIAVLGLLAANVRTVPFIGEIVYNIVKEVQRLQGR